VLLFVVVVVISCCHVDVGIEEEKKEDDAIMTFHEGVKICSSGFSSFIRI